MLSLTRSLMIVSMLSLVRSEKVLHVMGLLSETKTSSETNTSIKDTNSDERFLIEPIAPKTTADTLSSFSTLFYSRSISDADIKILSTKKYFNEVSLEDLNKAVLEISKKEFEKQISSDQRKAISLLSKTAYRRLRQNKRAMMLYVAFALHNTSFLSQMEVKDSSNYKSRGPMQITGFQSYKEMTKLSTKYYSERKRIDFEKNPAKATALETSVFDLHVRIFQARIAKAKLFGRKLTVKSASEALKVKEYMESLKKEGKELPEGTKRVMKIYDALKKKL